MKHLICAIIVLSVSGCSGTRGLFGSRAENVNLLQGPPIADVRTGFDEALSCLNGKIPKGVVFAVGQVIDSTGKENYADGGAGKYVTQGGGEIVQSALFRAGVSVVNRRDSSITINEANWGIRDITRQVPVNFYISGSINSLDFIPGGGATATVSGIGPRYRQSRILIALDLSLTDAFTGRVVASIPLQKQIFSSELGVGVNNFFGTTLVMLDAGGMHREATHFALRQMLNLATFELLGQIMPDSVYSECRARIDEGIGAVNNSGTATRDNLAATVNRSANAPALAIPVSQPDAPQPLPAAATQQAPVAAITRDQLLGKKANEAATMAIRAARDSESAPDRKIAIQKASESLQLANLALVALKEAAAAGFGGDEGEVAAVVVQQALKAAQAAGTAAAARPIEVPQTEQAPDAPSAAAPGEATDPAANAAEAVAKPGFGSP